MTEEGQTTPPESPFGDVSLSASIPGLGYSQIHITLKAGVDPFKAAARFRDRMVETFGKEAIEATVTSAKAAAVPAASGAPRCNTHNRAMKPSAKGGGWYCSAKLGDGTYCQEKAQ